MIDNKNKILTFISSELKTYEAKENEKYRKKLLVIKDVLETENINNTCNKYNANKSSIYRWIKQIKLDGVNSIRNKRGRKEKISKEHMQEIVEVIKDDATHYGYVNKRWNGKALVDYINNKYKIEISIRKAQTILNNKLKEEVNDDIMDIEEEYILDTIEERKNIWFFLVFKVWQKPKIKVKKGREVISIIQNDIFYYLALNKDEGKVLIKERTRKTFKYLKDFIEEVLNNYVSLDNKVTFIMSNSPLNRKLQSELYDTDLQEIDLEVILYNIKDLDKKYNSEIEKIEDSNDLYYQIEDRADRYYSEFNPLYDIKYEILEKIRKNNQYYRNKVNKYTKDAIKKTIETRYDLY